jgi:hypothetical protein
MEEREKELIEKLKDIITSVVYCNLTTSQAKEMVWDEVWSGESYLISRRQK